MKAWRKDFTLLNRILTCFLLVRCSEAQGIVFSTLSFPPECPPIMLASSSDICDSISDQQFDGILLTK